MSDYYINIHLKAAHADAVREALTALFAEQGFALIGDEAAMTVVEDEDKLPDKSDWYGVVISAPTEQGWISVYVEDWQDSGLLAKGLSRALATAALEVWVAEETHWGYTYYENGEVLDRFANDPRKVTDNPAEATSLLGQPDALAGILAVPPSQFDRVLRDARANTEEFVGIAIDGLAQAVGLPFDNILIGYESFFEDDPDDYIPGLEQWNRWRHLAFRHPAGREQLAD